MSIHDEIYEPIVEQCQGCAHVEPEYSICYRYLEPAFQWANGKKCASATHLKKAKLQRKKINPLKGSKRKRKGMEDI